MMLVASSLGFLLRKDYHMDFKEPQKGLTARGTDLGVVGTPRI